jgi:hypothetical protein
MGWRPHFGHDRNHWGGADTIFPVAPFELANYEVRPRHLLEVIDERVVHRGAAFRANAKRAASATDVDVSKPK